MAKRLFTSESVTEGHPTRSATRSPMRCSTRSLKKTPTAAWPARRPSHRPCPHHGRDHHELLCRHPKIARDVIRDIGYDRAKYGFDCDTCGVITNIDEQSGDIAMGVDNSFENKESGASELDNGAGDQGMMFGYACTETLSSCRSRSPFPIRWQRS